VVNTFVCSLHVIAAYAVDQFCVKTITEGSVGWGYIVRHLYLKIILRRIGLQCIVYVVLSLSPNLEADEAGARLAGKNAMDCSHLYDYQKEHEGKHMPALDACFRHSRRRRKPTMGELFSSHPTNQVRIKSPRST